MLLNGNIKGKKCHVVGKSVDEVVLGIYRNNDVCEANWVGQREQGTEGSDSEQGSNPPAFPHVS